MNLNQIIKLISEAQKDLILRDDIREEQDWNKMAMSKLDEVIKQLNLLADASKLNTNELVLIRGIPGAGKSTYAQKYFPKCIKIESDTFFMASGQYIFDRNKLFEAHTWCQIMTKDYLKSGYSVVVSNTFTTMKEIKPYIQIAEQCKVSLRVIRLTKNFGNIHNVPQATMEAMQARFQDYPGETSLTDY